MDQTVGSTVVGFSVICIKDIGLKVVNADPHVIVKKPCVDESLSLAHI